MACGADSVLRCGLRLVVCVLVLGAGAVGAFRASRLSDSELLKALIIKRPGGSHQHCVAGGAKCFSSSQCCSGFVCAAFDDYFGQNPETPGYCVKEKDLTLCALPGDCAGLRAQCVALGRTGQRYCVNPPSGGSLDPQGAGPAQWRQQGALQYSARAHGGLGSACEDSSECNATSSDQDSVLCCQDVSRARQGVRRMCARVIAISLCILPASYSATERGD